MEENKKDIKELEQKFIVEFERIDKIEDEEVRKKEAIKHLMKIAIDYYETKKETQA